VVVVAVAGLFTVIDGSEEREAVCELKGALKGSIRLEEKENGQLMFSGEITGLKPPGNHGFHVHQNGALGNSCKDAGGHFNPGKKNHGDVNAAERVKRTEELVETVKKEKQSVTDQNQVYLRNEKVKMRKDLEREKVNRRQLEDKVNELLEAKQDGADELKSERSKYVAAERKRKTEQLRAEKACKERDDAVQSLHRKSRLLKEHQDSIHRLEVQVDTLDDTNQKQKTQLRQLQEAVRKKSEFEKEYDVHKKRLREREQRLAEREKQFEQKVSASKRPKPSSTSPSLSKRPGRPKIRDPNTRPSASGDPLHQFRNILPFHWIALLLLVLLMVSIAQKR